MLAKHSRTQSRKCVCVHGNYKEVLPLTARALSDIEMWKRRSCTVQATLAEYKALQKHLEAQLSIASDTFEAAQKAAASAAQVADKRLTQTQVLTLTLLPDLHWVVQLFAPSCFCITV